MIVRQVDWDDVDAAGLRAAQEAETAERYGTAEYEPGPAPTAEDITAFFVAFAEDGTPLGCGGLRQLDAGEAEVKRMFVAPEHRGTGVATQILHALESYGRERGWHRLLLETGAPQPDAIRFYTREGFSPIPAFGHYADSADSLCFAKHLTALDPADEFFCESCQ